MNRFQSMTPSGKRLLGVILMVAFLIPFLFWIDSHSSKVTESEPKEDPKPRKLVAEMTMEDKFIFCQGYAITEIEGLMKKNYWEMVNLPSDAKEECASTVEHIFDQHVEQSKNKIQVHPATVVLVDEYNSSLALPIWRIYEIGKVKTVYKYGKSLSYFPVKFDSECIFYTHFVEESQANKAHAAINKGYNDYFSKHSVQINIERDKDNVIHLGHKDCL